MLGYVAAVLAPFALLFFFSKRGRPFRVLGWAYVVFLAEMFLLHAKMYYVAPVYPMLFAAGAVWLEGATERKSTKRQMWMWATPAFALGVIAISGIYAPTILPILSVPDFLAYEHRMGIEQAKFENQQQGVLPQLYADMFGWPEMAQTVAAYFHALRRRSNGGLRSSPTATAMRARSIFGPKYGLPKSAKRTPEYWIWGRGGEPRCAERRP